MASHSPATRPPRLRQPWLAILLSIPLPGLGQIYNGQVGKGLLFILVHIANFILIHWFVGLITAPAFWLYALFDAVDTTERLNAQARKAIAAEGRPARAGEDGATPAPNGHPK